MADDVDRVVEADIATFRPGSAPPFAAIRARGLARRRRRRRATAVAAVLTPVLSAATALAAVTAGGLLRPPGTGPDADRPTPSTTVTPAPAGGEHVVAMRDRGTLVVLPAANVTGPALHTYGGGPVPRTVAAAGDGATFYVAESGPVCTATIFRLTAAGTEKVADVDLDVHSLAVSRDGRSLAYVGQRPTADAREVAAAARAGAPVPCRGETLLRVRDLGTGTERTWPRPSGRRGNHDDVHGPIHGLTWSPDGRHLAAYDALNSAVVELDIAARSPWAAAVLPHPVPPLPDSPPGERCTATGPEYLPDGELTALVKCVPRTRTSRTEWFVRTRLAMYDPATRRTGRTIIAFPADVIPTWVTLDARGTRAFVGGVFRGAYESIPPIGPGDVAGLDGLFTGARVVYRWTAGGALGEIARGAGAPDRIWW